ASSTYTRLLTRSITIPTSPTFLFFFTDTATPEIYTLSLHDALPIFNEGLGHVEPEHVYWRRGGRREVRDHGVCGHEQEEEQVMRSEEHTSELQSRGHLVCRLLLEKKKKMSDRGGCTDTAHPSSRGHC